MTNDYKMHIYITFNVIHHIMNEITRTAKGNNYTCSMKSAKYPVRQTRSAEKLLLKSAIILQLYSSNYTSEISIISV